MDIPDGSGQPDGARRVVRHGIRSCTDPSMIATGRPRPLLLHAPSTRHTNTPPSSPCASPTSTRGSSSPASSRRYSRASASSTPSASHAALAASRSAFPRARRAQRPQQPRNLGPPLLGDPQRPRVLPEQRPPDRVRRDRLVQVDEQLGVLGLRALEHAHARGGLEAPQEVGLDQQPAQVLDDVVDAERATRARGGRAGSRSMHGISCAIERKS